MASSTRHSVSGHSIQPGDYKNQGLNAPLFLLLSIYLVQVLWEVIEHPAPHVTLSGGAALAQPADRQGDERTGHLVRHTLAWRSQTAKDVRVVFAERFYRRSKVREGGRVSWITQPVCFCASSAWYIVQHVHLLTVCKFLSKGHPQLSQLHIELIHRHVLCRLLRGDLDPAVRILGLWRPLVSLPILNCRGWHREWLLCPLHGLLY